MPSLWLAS